MPHWETQITIEACGTKKLPNRTTMFSTQDIWALVNIVISLNGIKKPQFEINYKIIEKFQKNCRMIVYIIIFLYNLLIIKIILFLNRDALSEFGR